MHWKVLTMLLSRSPWRWTTHPDSQPCSVHQDWNTFLFYRNCVSMGDGSSQVLSVSLLLAYLPCEFYSSTDLFRRSRSRGLGNCICKFLITAAETFLNILRTLRPSFNAFPLTNSGRRRRLVIVCPNINTFSAPPFPKLLQTSSSSPCLYHIYGTFKWS